MRSPGLRGGRNSTGSCVPGRSAAGAAWLEHALGFEITPGTRHQLLIALDAGLARMHTSPTNCGAGGGRGTPFLLLLRKYRMGRCFRGCRPARRHQARGASFRTRRARADDAHLPGSSAASRMPCAQSRRPYPGMSAPRPRNRWRAGAPARQAYAPPPPMDKLAPVDDGSDGYYERLGGALDVADPLWKALVAGVAGLSPTAAREVAWRAAGTSTHRPVAAACWQWRRRCKRCGRL